MGLYEEEENIPKYVKPKVKKTIIEMCLLITFLFITLSTVNLAIQNYFQLLALITLAIASILLFFKKAFLLKEITK